ncbi:MULTISPECIES: terpene synthase family protein [unclassified Streptomyces]|uniref:terpene synthase family protein n=1 Tax=unclassified Streptomyces TaxID=2593676 RepID=UPI00364D7AAF
MTSSPPRTESAMELRFSLPAPVDLTPFRLHPQADQIEERSDAWAREHLAAAYPSREALEEFLERRAALWPCMSYPSADPGRLLWFCQWNQYWFMLDDRSVYDSDLAADPGRARRTYAAIRQVLNESLPAAEVPGRLRPLADLWAQSGPLMPAGLRARFAASTEDLLDGFEAEAALRADSAHTPDDLVTARRKASGVWMCTTFVEWGLGIDLTDDFAAHPALGRLSVLAGEQMIYHNEILSFRKEHFSGDTMNLVTAWAGPGLHRLQEAVDRAHAAATRAEEDFVTERDLILAGPLGERADVRAYLDELGYLMAGCLRYEYLVPRYHGPGHLWDGTMSGTVILTAERTVFAG